MSSTKKQLPPSSTPTLVMFFDTNDDPDHRSKAQYPYSYDPICIFNSSTEPTGSVYSDRLVGWYKYDVVRAKKLKHFGEVGDYYSNRSITSIQSFLRDLMDKPTLVVTRVEEQCNQATGHPLWYFAYAD